jgi:hypothetical protein
MFKISKKISVPPKQVVPAKKPVFKFVVPAKKPVDTFAGSTSSR